LSHEFAAKVGEMSLDDFVDLLYDNTLHNPLHKDSDTSGEEEISKAST
jgi:hypothetical protein